MKGENDVVLVICFFAIFVLGIGVGSIIYARSPRALESEHQRARADSLQTIVNELEAEPAGDGWL